MISSSAKGTGSRKFGQTSTTHNSITEKNKIGNHFLSWDTTTVPNFKQIRIGDVGLNYIFGWFDTEWHEWLTTVVYSLLQEGKQR